MMTVFNRIAALRGFARHPSQNREAVVEYQNRQLRRLVAHAYARVPYYRELFDAQGLKPRDVQSVDDLHKIPITSRDVVQQRSADALVARGVNHRRLIVHSTSGSSGKPVNVRRTWVEERVHGALRLRAFRSFGLRVSDIRCRISTPISVYGTQTEAPQRMVGALGVFRQTSVEGFEAPDVLVRRLATIHPQVVHGLPGLLARIAHTVDHDTLRSLRLRFIVPGGAMLTPLMRRQIEEGFAAPVYEVYGAHEFNLIAWQCLTTGELHCCDDGMIMEILDGGRPVTEGEPGEVVGTNLHSFAMPLIRYRLGDVVTKGYERCPCGAPFSTIRAIQGRMVDFFHLPGGRVLHPYQILDSRQRTAPWIREYQVTQERVDRVVIRIVPSSTPSPRELAEWRAPAAAVLGADVTLDVQLVPELRLEPRGKFRVFRSLVHSLYDDVTTRNARS
jgi:phenylacetate-CoA ligase